MSQKEHTTNISGDIIKSPEVFYFLQLRNGGNNMIKQYMALGISPVMRGAEKKEDIKRNIAHISEVIDAAIWLSGIDMPVRLITIPEGALQGFTDELFDWEHTYFADTSALDIPGEETELLGKKAKEYNAYIIAQAKVRHPKFPGKFFNSAFLIDPKGDVILQSYKLQVFCQEQSTVPHDVWDKWIELYGYNMNAFYPVADTDIGRIGLMVCQEGDYPEPARGLAMNGAELIYRSSAPEPAVANGLWGIQNQARALDNTCYVVAPNLATYYPTQNAELSVDVFGGQSMICNYMGQVISKRAYGGVSGYCGAIIDIESLREYRERSLFGNWMKDLRTEQYKLIYEEPIFEKNLCLDRTPLRRKETHDLYRQSVQRLIDRGIWVPSCKK